MTLPRPFITLHWAHYNRQITLKNNSFRLKRVTLVIHVFKRRFQYKIAVYFLSRLALHFQSLFYLFWRVHVSAVKVLIQRRSFARTCFVFGTCSEGGGRSCDSQHSDEWAKQGLISFEFIQNECLQWMSFAELFPRIESDFRMNHKRNTLKVLKKLKSTRRSSLHSVLQFPFARLASWMLSSIDFS